MQFGNAVVVAIEKREKISGKVLLVGGTQRSDNAKVHCRVPGFGGIVDLYEYVARMHVRMKKVVAKNLGKEYLDAIFGKHANVSSRVTQRLHISDWNTVDSLLDKNAGSAIVPIHVRYIQHI